jgi:hypothetical protein
MMTCEACDTAAVNPQSGLYYANCTGCELRAFRNGPTYHAHMVNLKRTPGSYDRRAYLDVVEHNEGKELADVLRSDFGQWWESQRVKR